MSKRVVWLGVTILLLVFGLLQCNDGDWIIWMPVYFITALFSFGESQNKNLNPWSYTYLFILSIGISIYIPDFIDWIGSGTPSITGAMKAENQYIEFVREFFGLLICFFAMLYVSLKTFARGKR